MRTFILCLLCLVLLLPGAITLAQADSYPFQSKSFLQEGVVEQVDSDRDRVILKADDGRRYTLDTSDSRITLADGSRGGVTADLSLGMRVHVAGKLLSAGIAEALQVRVLEAQTATATPIPADDPNAIIVRGNVKTVNTHLGAFDLKIKDHTRTILLADDTDLSGLGKIDAQTFPVNPGDRITVAGELQPDGTVLAGAISFSRDLAFPTRQAAPQAVPQEVVLVGQISSQSNRYSSRDIKIRLANDREVKIKVPRGVAVRRDGQPISVHDLRGEETVRVTGTYDGNDFRATRIDSVRPEKESGARGLSRL